MEKKELDALAAELRAELRSLAKEFSPLPQVLDRERAARELSIGESKLKGMIRSGQILECQVGDRMMIPASEIFRLSQPAKVTKRAGGRTKKAPHDPRAEAAKLRELRRKKKR